MIERHDFPDKPALAAALAEAVAGDLKAGIEGRGVASLAVSGGSTPARFFAALGARTDLDWSKVVVTLVDERWVDETSDRSNGRLVRANLLQGPAAEAEFVPLYAGTPEPDVTGLGATKEAIAAVPSPFDAVILGMGNDGHTASFFPGGDRLSEALTTQEPVISMQAPGAGEPRVTFTLTALLATKSLYLHIEGVEKTRVLEEALADGPVEDMPVRAILRQTQRPLAIYWAP